MKSKNRKIPGGTLVIQPLPGVSDMVSYVRALRAIARHSSGGEISLLCRAKSQSKTILGHEEWVRQVLFLDEEKHFGPLGGLSLGMDLKAYSFDRVWILHHSPRYYIASSFAGIRERYGYGFGWLKDFLTTPHTLTGLDKALDPIHKFEKLLGIHEINLLEEDQKVTPRQEDIIAIEKRYEHLPKPWGILGFDTTNPSRIWPSSHFAELACNLPSKGIKTIFLCGTKSGREQDLEIAKMTENMGGTIHLASHHDLGETMALIFLSHIFIGNNSQLFNLSTSIGTPSWGILPSLGFQKLSFNILANALESCRHPDGAGIENITPAHICDSLYL